MARTPNPNAANRTTMTVAIDCDMKRALKFYALSRDMTVSDVIADWVRLYCRPVQPPAGAAENSAECLPGQDVAYRKQRPEPSN